jgi:hypothetical protein
MPDAGASRKRQISGQRIPRDLTAQAEAAGRLNLKRRRPDRLYLPVLICDEPHLRRRSGDVVSGIFCPAKIGWIEAGATGHRVVPGMKIKSSGDAARPAASNPAAVFIFLQQKVRFAASLYAAGISRAAVPSETVALSLHGAD